MVRVDASNINDVLKDGKLASIIYNKDGGVIWEKLDDSIMLAGSTTTNRTLGLDVPNWCNYIEFIVIGAGGGGEAGSGSDGQNGIPANAGYTFTDSYDIPRHIDRNTTSFNVQMKVGPGGAGGTSGGGTGRHGKVGSSSVLSIHQKDTTGQRQVYSRTATGGLPGPTSGRTRGGTSGGTPALSAPRYLFRPAQAGVGVNLNPAPIWYGVGGGAGTGGVFNKYNYGGRGAPGLILVAFSGRPTPPPPITGTVQITLGSDLEARDQLRSALADRGLNHTTVTEIPFEIALYGEGSARDMFRACAALTSVPDMDTSGVTNMRSMFNGCAALTTVPDMDTSQVTNMSYMFQDCSSLTTAPTMDTSKVVAMDSMFRACSALTYVPDMQTRNVTNVSYMFSNCSSLTDGNVSLIGRHPDVITTDMITGSGLTREPFYDTAGNPI